MSETSQSISGRFEVRSPSGALFDSFAYGALPGDRGYAKKHAKALKDHIRNGWGFAARVSEVPA